MGKLCTKHILRLLWKMAENMFFPDSEHVEKREKAPAPKSTIFIDWKEASSNGGNFPQTPSPE